MCDGAVWDYPEMVVADDDIAAVVLFADVDPDDLYAVAERRAEWAEVLDA
jgi:hypothetical protein